MRFDWLASVPLIGSHIWLTVNFPDSTSVAAKIKALQNALDLVLQCAPILKIMCERNATDDAGEASPPRENGTVNRYEKCNEDANAAATVRKVENEEAKKAENEAGDNNNESSDDRLDDTAEEQKLIELMESRLQYILRSLIKHCSTSTK